MVEPITQDELLDTEVEPDPIISRVVPDKSLKAIITSDKGDYEFQIYTERAAKDAVQTGLRRTYALIELAGGSKMVENWGRLDEPAMIRILSNLLRFSDYTMTKVVSGWSVTCPECGHVEKGKHYEPQPRACKSAKSGGCALRDSKVFTQKAEITEVEERFD
jgi:hypothetical protein